jgi:6-pyruvoyltetrahydropterin/6-carboxytetrahydropterin synthase
MSNYQSTKIIELGSCAFRQWRATHSHCRFLHGYQLKAKLWFGGSALDEKNWIVDFGGLKELKAKLQHVFDHTTTVAADDPELATFEELDKKGIIQLRVFEKGVGIERAAELVHSMSDSYVKSLTNGRCWVEKVEVFEHEDNSATFSVQEESKGVAQVVIQEQQPTQTTTAAATEPVTTSTGAHVGSNTSEGKGNWFAGTSWG